VDVPADEHPDGGREVVPRRLLQNELIDEELLDSVLLSRVSEDVQRLVRDQPALIHRQLAQGLELLSRTSGASTLERRETACDEAEHRVGRGVKPDVERWKPSPVEHAWSASVWVLVFPRLAVIIVTAVKPGRMRFGGNQAIATEVWAVEVLSTMSQPCDARVRLDSAS
jgi:hypothetical protein